MQATEKIVNAVKDGWLWAADKIEKHPHVALVLITALALLAVLT